MALMPSSLRCVHHSRHIAGGEQLETYLQLIGFTCHSSWCDRQLLLKHGADPNSSLHAAVSYTNVDALHLLLRHGGHHSFQGKNGWTPLALAARNGSMEIVTPLLTAGANPNTPAAFGKSARDLAVINQNVKLVEVFDSYSRPIEDQKGADLAGMPTLFEGVSVN